MAHGYVVSAASPEGEHAVCAGGSSHRRQYLVLQYVSRLGGDASDPEAPVEGRRLKHDGTYNSGGYVREGVTATDDPMSSPGTYHPIGLRHPETGRIALYLGRRRNAYVEGLEPAESEALLDELWSFATRPDLAWSHRWRVGDVVLWDNRCTMHRRDPFDASARRIMHRTQVK